MEDSADWMPEREGHESGSISLSPKAFDCRSDLQIWCCMKDSSSRDLTSAVHFAAIRVSAFFFEVYVKTPAQRYWSTTRPSRLTLSLLCGCSYASALWFRIAQTSPSLPSSSSSFFFLPNRSFVCPFSAALLPFSAFRSNCS